MSTFSATLCTIASSVITIGTLTGTVATGQALSGAGVPVGTLIGTNVAGGSSTGSTWNITNPFCTPSNISTGETMTGATPPSDGTILTSVKYQMGNRSGSSYVAGNQFSEAFGGPQGAGGMVLIPGYILGTHTILLGCIPIKPLPGSSGIPGTETSGYPS